VVYFRLEALLLKVLGNSRFSNSWRLNLGTWSFEPDKTFWAEEDTSVGSSRYR
jgi:hypothetical protein